MQNVMQIATNAGHTAQNDGQTAQNDGRTMQNDGRNTLNVCQGPKGGLEEPPWAPVINIFLNPSQTNHRERKAMTIFLAPPVGKVE